MRTIIVASTPTKFTGCNIVARGWVDTPAQDSVRGAWNSSFCSIPPQPLQMTESNFLAGRRMSTKHVPQRLSLHTSWPLLQQKQVNCFTIIVQTCICLFNRFTAGERKPTWDAAGHAYDRDESCAYSKTVEVVLSYLFSPGSS